VEVGARSCHDASIMADKDSRAGSRYAEAEVLRYVNELHAAHDDALGAADTAPDREGVPAIQVGASEGRLLQLLLRLVGARKIVEVGTLVGYSGIWMARALPPGGRLYTVEADPRHAELAQRHFEAAGVADRVEVRVGPADEVLPGLSGEGPFDAVFIDADKGRYPIYGRWAKDHLRPGGLLLGDNAYLFGRLVEDSEEGRAMRAFHEEAAAAFDTVCIPTPDGLLLGIRR
jgi:caffeoyl-CoA O-methyltransferase